MKIALLHYSSPPVVGGVESVMAYHARMMADGGHQVSIIAGRGESFDARIPFISIPLADSRHPEILAIKAELDVGCVPQVFSDVVARLCDQLKSTLSDVGLLIAHNVCSLHKNLPLTAALRELFVQRVFAKLILWHHDFAWTTPRYRAELHDGYPWNLLLEDWSGVTHVVVSELRQRELSGLIHVPLDRIIVIPNGVDIGRFGKLETKTLEFVNRLGLLHAEPLLLLPVRITPRKNIELAIKTVAALQAIYPDVALVITGPLGPHNPANLGYFSKLLALRDKLKLRGAVHFLAELSEEYLPDEVIADFYHLSDALFFPSREEGFGIPILEAALTGIPVFCSDIPPLRELAGEYGIYFSPEGNPMDIADLVASHLRSNPSFELRARVRTSYTWESIYAEQISPLLSSG